MRADAEPRRGYMANAWQWIGRTFSLTDVEPFRVYAKNADTGGGAYRAVTIDGALALTVVFACIRLLSDVIANLPVDVYRRTGPKKSVEVPGHPVASLFALRPNLYMTPEQFVKWMQAQLEGWGNAFAEIQRGVMGNLIGLLPLRSSGMSLAFPTGGARNTWPIGYNYVDERGHRSFYHFDQLLHLRGPFGGMWGISPIANCRLSVSGAIGAEDYGARMYAKGLRRAGYLTPDQNLKDDAQVQMVEKAIVDPMYDPDKTIVVLPSPGWKFDPISLSPEDAQYIETRRWQTAELLRLFGVPPHLVGELDRATYGNIEDQGIDFARYTLATRVGAWQSEMRAKLFPANEQRDHFVRFNLEALMKGNAGARASFYNVMTRAGIMSVNECREKEDLEPREGGDELRVQAQMTPLDQAGAVPAPQQQPKGGQR